jgi:CBS domain-containing protein
MRVAGITLLPIGGVSSIEQLPEHPRDELVVAAAGPLSSLGLAAGCALVTALNGGAHVPPALTVGALSARMAWFNLVLAGFNLLPAFPMDGGRVLRAWLERRMTLVDATARAASTGRAAALVMGGAGLLWNPWLVLIAVFVYLGATAEQRATLVHARLAGLRVGDAMVTEITALAAERPVREVRELLRHAGQREVPLLAREGTFGGMIDGLWIAQYGEDDLPVGTYADTSVPALTADLALEDAVVELSHYRQPAAAVVDVDRHILGVVRLDDIRRLLAPAARQTPFSRK